jgi:hypothetical protein
MWTSTPGRGRGEKTNAFAFNDLPIKGPETARGFIHLEPNDCKIGSNGFKVACLGFTLAAPNAQPAKLARRPRPFSPSTLDFMCK